MENTKKPSIKVDIHPDGDVYVMIDNWYYYVGWISEEKNKFYVERTVYKLKTQVKYLQ